MPPEERFLPRFAAEPPQEELPYGRWEERLRQEFLSAALKLDGEPEDLGEPGELIWYPDRSWHGRTYVPPPSMTRSPQTSPPTSTSPRRPRRRTPTGAWICARR